MTPDVSHVGRAPAPASPAQPALARVNPQVSARFLCASLLTILLAISLAGCVLKGKPATANTIPAAPKPAALPTPPPPPPAPLSISQPHPDLPAPQPISAEALATTEAPGEPAPPPPAPTRVTKKGSTPPARPRTDVPASATPPPAPASPAAAPEPDARPPIQEILPAEDANRLRASANEHKREIRRILDRLPRGLSKEQRDNVRTIQNFLKQSDDAENSGDMRKANDLAERGLVLAQGLQNAR